MKNTSLAEWVAFSLWPGLGVSSLKRALANGFACSDLFEMEAVDWRSCRLPWRAFENRVLPSASSVQAVLAWVSSSKSNHILPYTDGYYSPYLREISQPPLVLYAQGSPQTLCKKQIAVVGSRRARPRSLEFAYVLSEELSNNGLVVTSGLALGVDTAAHRGALRGSSETVAVMANGLGEIYPRSNTYLASQIKERGVLLSEQPPWVGPCAVLFPRRNRLVSGLSRGVVIVEARLRSGSLITARLALEQNREVMAVPGDAGSSVAAGCHSLLKEGAALVESAGDVLSVLGEGGDCISSRPNPEEALSTAEVQVLSAVDSSGCSLEQIIQRCDQPESELMALLSRLELKGKICRELIGYARLD